jgi:hypothetical protein
VDDDMPEDDIPVEIAETVDLTPVLTRQLTWDIMPCGQVEGLLLKLGMTPSHPDGAKIEHANSHERIATVAPMEPVLQQLASITGTIVSLAMTEEKGITEELGDAMQPFAEQNAEVALCSTRAILAQLLSEGILGYTPEALAVIAGGEDIL